MIIIIHPENLIDVALRVFEKMEVKKKTSKIILFSAAPGICMLLITTSVLALCLCRTDCNA